MHKINSIIILFTVLSSCNTNAQEAVNPFKKLVSPVDFAQEISKDTSPTILDVRTEGEYAGGFIAGAKNTNFYDPNFMANCLKHDTNKPVYVYCLSGGRSAAATKKLKLAGFKQIYELQGGIMKWKASNLPIANKGVEAEKGMSMKDYEALLDTNLIVLVDFYAPWCAPCKKMKPYLDEIAAEMKDKVLVVRIDIDKNKQLSKELKISELPMVYIYNGKDIKWKKNGFATKEEMVAGINSI